MIIFYCQATLDDRLVLIFSMYKNDEEAKTIKVSEMRFVVEKVAAIIASNLSMRKNVLQEVVRNFSGNKVIATSTMNELEFVNFMRSALQNVILTLEDLEHHIFVMKHMTQKNMLPDHLQVNKVFLGKYKINAILSHREIKSRKLFKRKNTVFG
jgi:flagellar biosynthesis chaperone FliJ